MGPGHAEPDALAVGYGSVWAIDSAQPIIRRIDPQTVWVTVRA
jgi:streptogramin lyase